MKPLFTTFLSLLCSLSVVHAEPVSTINPGLQAIAEAAIAPRDNEHITKNDVLRSGMLVLDPKTGDILAKATYTSPEMASHDEDYLLQTVFTPGRALIVVPAAAALNEGKTEPDTLVSCGPFQLSSDSERISDGIFHYGALPVWGILAKGSNPGAARLGLMCPTKTLREYLTRFGIDPDEKPRPPFGRCQGGYLSSLTEKARLSIGFGIGITPLHLASVYATIANKGVRMAPRLSSEGAPAEGQRVVSEETAAALLNGLEATTRTNNPIPVRRGIAARAALDDCRTAAMTMTNILDLSAKPTHTVINVCCVGILPADDPQLVVLAILDVQTPNNEDGQPPKYYNHINAHNIAIPVFRAAAPKLLQAFGKRSATSAAH